MKRKGSSIIFINDNEEILLFQRDNINTIPYPDMWDVPGGHVESGEKPEECIVREMNEEMGLNLREFNLSSVISFDDRVEYTFWKKENLNINKIDLKEGQRLKWFTRAAAARTHLAYGFNEIIEYFFIKEEYIDKED